MRLARLSQTALLLTALVPGVAFAQTQSAPKLDESLRESVANGCVGTKSVIVRLKPGYREGLRISLTEHGDVVKGEFPGLDAVAAEVHCEDLSTLAGFTSTNSVSLNGPVGVQSLLQPLVTSPVLSDATAAVTAARAALVSARDNAAVAQSAVRVAETAASVAQAQLGTAQKAVAAANKLTGLTRTAALAVANLNVTAAQAALSAAQTALNKARMTATSAQAAVLAAQAKFVEAQNALDSAAKQLASREREGQAARGLKKKFFATMAAGHDSEVATDELIDSNNSDGSVGQNAWGERRPRHHRFRHRAGPGFWRPHHALLRLYTGRYPRGRAERWLRSRHARRGPCGQPVRGCGADGAPYRIEGS